MLAGRVAPGQAGSQRAGPALARALLKPGAFLPALLVVASAAGVVCLSAVVLAVVLGAARPAPDLQAVLGQAPCAAPCWHGIRPGITRLQDAVSELRRDPAIGDLTENIGSATWWWNGAQPGALSGHSRPFDGRLLASDSSAGNRVEGVAIYTALKLGDLLPALGTPDSHSLVLPGPSADLSGRFYVADYGELQFFAFLPCSLRPADFWNADAGVAFGEVNFGGETQALPARPNPPLETIMASCPP